MPGAVAAGVVGVGEVVDVVGVGVVVGAVALAVPGAKPSTVRTANEDASVLMLRPIPARPFVMATVPETLCTARQSVSVAARTFGTGSAPAAR